MQDREVEQLDDEWTESDDVASVQRTGARHSRRAAHDRRRRPQELLTDALRGLVDRLPEGDGSAGSIGGVHVAAWLSGLACVVFAIFFSGIALERHDNFGSWSFDLGIYDQATWLLSRFGRTFLTVRGLEFWGHHVNPILYLYAPFFRLGFGARLLLSSQAIVMAAGGMACYLIARDRFRSPWWGLLFALVFLGYAPTELILISDFHPEALMITPFLFAWWFAQRRSWRGLAICAVLVLATREDAALPLGVMGLVLLAQSWHLRRSSDPGDRRAFRAGAVLFAASLGWYLFCVRIVIPHANGTDDPFYFRTFYGDWGGSMSGVIFNVLRHPDRVIADAVKPDRLRFYRDLLLPLGGTPVAAFGMLLMTGGQMLAAVIGSSPYARMIRYQYTSPLVAPMLIASIQGTWLLARNRRIRMVLPIWMLGCSYLTNVAWSPSPVGARRAEIAKPLPRHDRIRAAMRLIPEDAKIAATFSMLPHLAERRVVYDWPNPWRPSYWGIMEADPPPQGDVDWLALDKVHLDDQGRQMVTAAIARGEFRVVLDDPEVWVLRRARPHRDSDEIGPSTAPTTVVSIPVGSSPAVTVAPPEDTVATAVTVAPQDTAPAQPTAGTTPSF